MTDKTFRIDVGDVGSKLKMITMPPACRNCNVSGDTNKSNGEESMFDACHSPKINRTGFIVKTCRFIIF